MKKLNLSVFTLLILFVAFGFSSCTKQKYCAQCYENISGYQANDYCGTSDQVDTYMDELNNGSSNTGQIWSCSKVAE